MPRLTTNDIGTWIVGEDSRLNSYTLAQTHGSPVCTLNLHYARHPALVLDRWRAAELARDLLRFHHTHHLSNAPTGPDDYSI